MEPTTYTFLFTVLFEQALYPEWEERAKGIIDKIHKWEKTAVVEAENIIQAVGLLEESIEMYVDEHHARIRSNFPDTEKWVQIVGVETSIKDMRNLGTDVLFIKKPEPLQQ